MKIALTSCREHSRRLYRKELNMLGSKTIMEYTLDQMVECKDLFDILIFTTDWKEILNKFRDSYPEIVFLERPKPLAENNAPAQAYISYTLEPYHQKGNEYCLLQSTSPLRKKELIYDTYKAFTEEYMSLFTVNKNTLQPDGQVYWFREYTDIFRSPSYIYCCKPTIDIDTKYNLRVAEFLLRWREDNEK